MDPDEVKAALDGAWNGGEQGMADEWFWTPHQAGGVIGVYDQGSGLVAVTVKALKVPLVWVGAVELIGGVPSVVRAEIHVLASRQGAGVRANRIGGPEIMAASPRFCGGRERDRRLRRASQSAYRDKPSRRLRYTALEPEGSTELLWGWARQRWQPCGRLREPLEAPLPSAEVTRADHWSQAPKE
ncbi:hypothetical protein ACFQ64_16350 [Streptomyces sp. NPDC056460]|uniref:hypothetical protein n=1 Tax=Streptomyces sp. NPDC056460 TaxID=3345825 RepID=UPI0036C69FB2